VNVSVIGCGYVGSHLADVLETQGHEVNRYDPPKGLSALRPGQGAYIVCVPTPLDNTGGPDLSHVERAVADIAQVATSPALIILESTVAPGTTRRLLGPLHDRGHRVAYSPERIDPGSGRDMAGVPKLVAGIDRASSLAALALYSDVTRHPVECASLEVAELAKLHENAYRAVNIALVDELAALCRAVDVDPADVLDAAATKPFGFQRFDSGPGPGGHCIPVDPAYLLDTADEHGVRMPTLGAAHTRNRSAVTRNVDRVIDAMGGLGGKVAVLGLTYKPGVADMRGSAGLELQERLSHLYDVSVHDPRFAPWPLAEASSDLLVVCTAHHEYLDLRDQTRTPILDLTGRLHPASASASVGIAA
jgi:UDP-N-acetyl-D-glucosamine dehydrogenase